MHLIEPRAPLAPRIAHPLPLPLPLALALEPPRRRVGAHDRPEPPRRVPPRARVEREERDAQGERAPGRGREHELEDLDLGQRAVRERRAWELGGGGRRRRRDLGLELGLGLVADDVVLAARRRHRRRTGRRRRRTDGRAQQPARVRVLPRPLELERLELGREARHDALHLPRAAEARFEGLRAG